MNLMPTFEGLDYEGLSRLAHDDPAAYEAMRQRLIDRFIDNVPGKEQRRLRGLQFRIDQVRRLARSPLAATIKISSLMWSSFLCLNEELSGRHYVTPRPLKTAKVISFRPHRDSGGAA